MRKKTPRALAREAGEKYYSTGKPCKNGHMAPRATVSGSCVQCTRNASAQWAKERPERMAQYTAAYRARNKDEVLRKDREYKAYLRATEPERMRGIKQRSYGRVRLELTGEPVRRQNKLLDQEIRKSTLEAHSGSIEFVGGYVNKLSNARFLCVLHNEEFLAAPHNVLRGANPCTKCNHTKSKPEESLASYLSTFTQVIQRDRSIIAPKELDIVLPEHGLAVEYCGMYWHSAMKSEDEPEFRTKHKVKYDMAAEKGLRLVTIYESEWLDRPHAIRRLLRNAIGKSRGKLMARKCELRKVSHKEAVEFFERYHPQGGAGHGENYALIHKGKIVACMRFTLGANDRGVTQRRTWTLSRYATRITVSGGASRLFTSFVRDFNPGEVKSFSDNRYFSGGMYEQLGFVLDAELSPDYMVWSPKIGLRPKPHYQRRKLPARQADHGVTVDFDPKTDTRTEAQVTYAMGCGRIFDCGKKRWVWVKQ